jgi:hypothetical protein
MADWILLKFEDNWSDESDHLALVVTTRERWEGAKAALLLACPSESFACGDGNSEPHDYTAREYLDCFQEHPISLECARDLARVVGRDYPQLTFDGGRVVSQSWALLVKHGALPTPPDKLVENWLLRLAFPAPPARCAAHGNVIGECDQGRDPSRPWAPPCRHDEDVLIVQHKDPDYDALVQSPESPPR